MNAKEAKKPHPTIAVKVNAPVDVGIAPLIWALSELPIYSIDSCQGGEEKAATVSFRYLGSEKEEVEFFACLAETLATATQEEWLFTFTLEFNCGSGPMGYIRCAPESVARVAEVFRSTITNDPMASFLRNKAWKKLPKQ